MPRPGDQFDGFTLVREVGRGAMGTVWEARQDSLDRIVALKLLSGAFAADPVWVARFKAEAGQASRLSHPGILPVYAVGETGGINWFAMELVRGEDLGVRLARGPLPVEEATRWVRDAALALDHAHQSGIVHRDVKPANLMLRDDGRVAITDFGLAKTMGSGALTTTGLLVGTPYYMSPEVASGRVEDIGPWTDVYGLGVTLYELLTGRPPFLSQSTVALIRQITEEDPKPPSSHRADIPRDLETIVLSAMSKEPAARYRTAKALADDLERFLAGETIAVRRPGLGERLMRKAKRHRTGVALSLAAVLGLAGTAVFFLTQEARQEAEHRAEVDELLRDFEERMAEDEIDEAERPLAKLESLLQTAEGRSRLAALRERHSLEGQLLGPGFATKALPEIRSWAGRPSAQVDLAVDPVDAKVEVVALVGPPAEARPGEGPLPPGLYRLRASAAGRVDTVATLVVSPESRGRVEVRLPARDGSLQGFLHYAGLWIPERWQDPAKSPTSLVRAWTVPPCFLSARPVTRREYEEFVAKQPADQRARWEPRLRPRRGPGAAAQPMSGVTFEQARDYAAAQGMRLPTEAEMKHAALAGLSRVLGREEGPAGRAGRNGPSAVLEDWREVADAVESAEGLSGVALPPTWVGRPAGEGLPWPRRGYARRGLPRTEGPSPQSHAALATIRLAKDAP